MDGGIFNFINVLDDELYILNETLNNLHYVYRKKKILVVNNFPYSKLTLSHIFDPQKQIFVTQRRRRQIEPQNKCLKGIFLVFLFLNFIKEKT